MRLKIPRGAPPLLFVALLLVVSFGCKKNKNPQGHILEYGTDKPIEGATVTLSECEGQVLGSFNCSSVATTLTDEDGYFCFDNDGFAFTAKAPGYWDMDDAAIFDINSSRPVPKTVYLYPHAWMELTIKNESGAYAFNSGVLGFNEQSIQLNQNEETTRYRMVTGNSDLNTGGFICWMDGGLISNCDIAIGNRSVTATAALPHIPSNILLTNKATLRDCIAGISLEGGQKLGSVTASCAQFIDNQYGISGI